jgi:hypothetical protein
MRMNITAALITTAFSLVPCGLVGQQVDPSVQPVDPSANVRVQDVDRPDSALLPGGSNAWTGQPIMSQTSSLPAQKSSAVKSNQFPSLTGVSTWGTTPVSELAASNTTQAPDRARGAQPSSKFPLSRKTGTKIATVDVQLAKSNATEEEIAEQEKLEEENQQARNNNGGLNLHKLRQETARSTRSTRTRVTNPLRAKADAASSGRWHSDQSSSYALNQQQHEENSRLQNGYYDRALRRRKYHHGAKAHTPGSRD